VCVCVCVCVRVLFINLAHLCLALIGAHEREAAHNNQELNTTHSGE
jgi:hypothetical protein